ncbi:MAG: pyridoxamine 5'-phosphate oxidase family protein [Bacteroidia bacterium]|nr:pyridoxamine 5'-phosphate oxidase family protein [Bacteroidia bacterium]MBT8268832.1 pyridoxamine 5'-phosphate oxidase family protein [Bacteroidia bacterium]NNK70971.1 pyridoxamine 5'-phosphate oxidase family protein [Flavobacteriaceae bacterium]NNL79138.1 pyridoxamine 5'-phosphate oxidase family protein [Flavobacteriaceae bacterium]
MGKRAKKISKREIEFIKEQKMFFVGTAAEEGRINVSPKGMDTFRVMSPNEVLWLNLTGSGNETAAHVLRNKRMTIMFCSFEGKPLILRLYGTAEVYHERDEAFQKHIKLFPNIPGIRQIFSLKIDLVQSSCGFGVPEYEYKGQRTLLEEWAVNKGEDGIKTYWADKNVNSLDNLETAILDSPE